MATPTTLPASWSAGQVLTAATLNNLRGAFRVLQIVSTAKTDTYTTSSTTFGYVTGLTASITPSATSSLILVHVSISSGNNATAVPFFRLRRGSTDINVGNAAGSRIRVTTNAYSGNGTLCPTIMTFLDTPATTSATTYAVHMASNAAGVQCHVNRTETDTDSATFSRGASTITVMEISA